MHLISLLIIVLVILVILAIFVYIRRAKKRSTVLLLGPWATGKTALFYRLARSHLVQTCTSMQENVGTISNTGALAVDIPGHQKVRLKYHDYLQSTAGIVFMVDASIVHRTLREPAEFLHDLLVEPLIMDRGMPLAILCNKSDELISLKPAKIQSLLETEIDAIRKTRGAGLLAEGDDHQQDSSSFLGFENEAFKFEHIPHSITWIQCSVKNNTTGDSSDGSLIDALTDTVQDWIK